MANEIQVTGLGTGITDLFVYIIQATGADIGKVRDVVAGAWDAFVLADLGDYDVALTEAGVSGIYLGDMPALAAGRYIVVPFQGVPASQSITAYYDGALMVWNGTAEVFDIDTSGRVDVGKIAGTAQTANDNGADINAILVDTAEIANLNNVSITEINRECDTAISDAALATAASLAAVAGYIDTEIAAILEDTGTTIPAQITGLNNVSAQQVWDFLTSGIILSDSIGLQLKTNVDALITSRNAIVPNTVVPDNTSIGAILTLIQAAGDGDVAAMKLIIDTLSGAATAGVFTETALENAPTAEMDATELWAALDLYTASGGSLKAITDALALLYSIQESDGFIDTSDPTQHQLVIHKKGDTATEYMRKNLKDASGDPIVNFTTPIGGHSEP